MADCAPLRLHLFNSLASPLRLSLLSEAPAEAGGIPLASRWLPAHHHRSLLLPASRGWLVAEQLIWRGVMEEEGRTYVIRRASNIS
ncbi:MAG: hypothetical protein SGPRY_004532, partial [Prymnesium sp.]